MRNFITIVEDLKPRNAPAKSFDEVTVEDVIRAMFDTDDIQHVMTSGRWDDIYFDNEDLPDIPVPQHSKDIPDEHMLALVKEYTDNFTRVKNELSSIAALPKVGIKRRLSRLTDLSSPLGVHWSWQGRDTLDPDMDHFGPHIIYAQIDTTQVDWISTIARAIFWWTSEGEITAQAGSSLTLERLEFGEGGIGKA